MSDLKQAAQLIKAGQKAEARKIVGALLKREPENDDAWYYAAMLSDAPEQRAKFLQKALDLNPFHERADAALKKIGGRNMSTSVGTTPASSARAGVASGGMIAAIVVVALLLVGVVAYGVITMTRGGNVTPVAQIAPTSVSISAADFAATGTAVAGMPIGATDAAGVGAGADAPLGVPTDNAQIVATATPAAYQITSTAYLHIAQTADANLRATATAAAGG
jgi:hypothetical protein